MKKRAYKLQEFVAHADRANCLRIGRKSGQLLVTGGDDRRVNLWQIGKPNAILSLSGHTTPVESVTFDPGEEVVVAGSAGGTIKLWDLEQEKAARTLTGHRAAVTAVDFHPYGEYFASGSVDTNLKIWDIRRKACIQTYKGHTQPLSRVQFSPDGRWVASASTDGTIKVWDLTAGKKLGEFTSFKGSVLSMNFHPNEFLLGAASQDRTMRLFDLERFEEVSNPDGSDASVLDTSTIHHCCFSSDGSSLLVATGEALKVYQWEPTRQLDFLDVSWGPVADLYMNPSSHQLVSCALQDNFVTVWMVDMLKLAPFQDSSESAPAAPTEPVVQKKPDVVAAPAEPQRSAQSRPVPEKSSQPRKQFQQPVKRAPAPAPAEVPVRSSSPPVEVYESRPPVRNLPPAAPSGAAAAGNDIGSGTGTPPYAGGSASSGQRFSAPSSASSSKFVPTSRSEPVGLDPTQFLPKGSQSVFSDKDVIEELVKSNAMLCGILSTRRGHVGAVAQHWGRNDVRSAVEHLSTLNDQSSFVDIAKNLLDGKQMTAMTLGSCCRLLPIATDLLDSQFEVYVLTAVQFASHMLQSFAPLIKNTLGSSPSVGVDLSHEERIEKCRTCLQLLRQCRDRLQTQLSSRMDDAGEASRTFVSQYDRALGHMR